MCLRGAYVNPTIVWIQADEVYCKIRAPLDRLMKEADRINMKLPLDDEKLRALCFAGRPVSVSDITVS